VSPDLVTLQDFGILISSSTQTARRIVERGELPAFRVGSRVMLRRADIDAWIERNRIRAEVTPDPTTLKQLLAAAVQRSLRRQGLA
jgi:excisionase family DNA binding protein